MILPEEMERIEFLRNLGNPYLNQFAKRARLQECSEGTVLFREGQDSPFIYFVLTGEVVLEVAEPHGHSVEVYVVGPGDLLGWSPVLGSHAMTATARAVAPCRLAVFDAKQIVGLCEQDPRFGVAFLRQTALMISERLNGTRRRLARAVSHRPSLAAVPEGSD
jgi:CRP-like cAMP-binding protein